MDENSLYWDAFDAVRDPLLVVDGSGDVHAANASAIRFLDAAQDAGLFTAGASRDGSTASIVGAGLLELVQRRLAARSQPLCASDGRDLGIMVDVEPLPGSAALLHFRSPTEQLARELWSDDAVAAVAHEIKNPLAAMRSALEVVLKDPSAPLVEPHRRMLGAFDRSARRLARFVDGVLKVSRHHAGAAPGERSTVPVDELVAAVIAEYRALHPHRCPPLESRIAEAGAVAFVERDGAEIVLLNLIGNAARFAPNGDAVTVHASRAGVESMEEDMRLLPWDVLGRPRLVRIDVEDRGLGMTPEVLAHLFDRYHAGVDEDGVVSTRETCGNHLGLHISRAIVEAHDGWLQVESRLGEGTVASIVVPEDEATARSISRLRLASECARRWRRAGRDVAVVALAKAAQESWEELSRRWPSPPRVDPIASTSASRRTLLWAFENDFAAALVPLAARGADPASLLGEPIIRTDPYAWGMRGFVAGWCRVDEAASFAQAFHRAASRMRQACAQIARGETPPAVPVGAASSEDEDQAVAVLPQRETTLHVESEE